MTSIKKSNFFQA